MNIKFTDLYIDNFLSLHKNIHIIFDKQHNFVVLTGKNENTDDNAKSNGSGKSAIFDALCWGLTGETIRGVKEVKNIFTDEDACVRIKMSVDDNKYEIVRTKGKQSTLKIFVNGEDKSGKGIRDSQTILENLLPDLTTQFIGSVIVLGQGLPHRFSNNTPSGRKEILENLTNSDYMIDDLKRKIESRKQDLNRLVTQNNNQKIEYETSIKSIETQIEDVANKIKEFSNVDELKSEQSKLTLEITELENKINELSNTVELLSTELVEQRQKYTNISTEEKSGLADIDAKHNNNIQNIQNEIYRINADVDVLSKEIKKIKSVVDVCPTCGQKIKGVIKPDTSEQEAKLKCLLENIATKKQEISAIEFNKTNERNKVIQSYEAKLSEATVIGKEMSAKLNQKKEFLQQLNTNLTLKKNRLSQIVAKINSFIENQNYFQNNLEKLQKNKVDFCEKIVYNLNNGNDLQNRQSIVKKFETIVTRDFRGYLLTNVIDYINKKCSEYSNVICHNNIQIVLDKNNVDIYYGNKIYESLSGGEKQKVDIVIQFALRQMLCVFMNFESNILVLDEIFDNCDSVVCDNLVKLITTKFSNIESVYIISHHIAELQIPYDYEIKVVKGKDNMSRIEV